jgi:hypothetical protein
MISRLRSNPSRFERGIMARPRGNDCVLAFWWMMLAVGIGLVVFLEWGVKI